MWIQKVLKKKRDMKLLWLKKGEIKIQLKKKKEKENTQIWEYE